MVDEFNSQIDSCIQRFSAGDRSARDELIALSAKRLRRLTNKMFRDFRRLRTCEETDDVVQSATVRLLRALEKVRPPSAADFFRLAAEQIRRELLDLARHYYGTQGGHALTNIPERDDEQADSVHEPAQLAEWREFHEMIEALPAKERVVFDLFWYHGLSQNEAAAVLNVSKATVKRWWLEARGRLKDRIPEAAR